MELLNTELLQKMITKIVRTVVREELAKRGSLVDQKMFNRKDVQSQGCSQISWRVWLLYRQTG